MLPICPSRADIEAARSPAGGWTKKQLAEWGVAWPPPHGWKKRLEQQSAPGPALSDHHAALLADADSEIDRIRAQLQAAKSNKFQLIKEAFSA